MNKESDPTRKGQSESSPEGAGPQKPYTHSDSGNSGNSKQTSGGLGTAGDVPEAKPGAPAGYK